MLGPSSGWRVGGCRGIVDFKPPRDTMRGTVTAFYCAFLLCIAAWVFTDTHSSLNQAAFFGVMAIFAILWIAFLGWLGHWLWQRYGANG